MKDRMKFRIWDAKSKTMAAVTNLDFSHDIIRDGENKKSMAATTKQQIILDVDTNQYKLMQSTGMKDTAGKLIYEGDLVEMDYPQGKSMCEVKWCELKHNFVLNPLKGEFPRKKPHFRLAGKRKISIIGNIYENADLVGNKAQLEKGIHEKRMSLSRKRKTRR